MYSKWYLFHFRIAVDLAQRKVVRAERLLDALDQGHHVLADGTGKEVNGAVIIFGPGMQTCMRLCEKQKTGKAVWAELVKALVHNRQAAVMYGLRKQRVCPLAIHENLMVAVGEIENKMLSQFQSRVHSHLQGTGLKIERTHLKASNFEISARSARCVPCVTGETAFRQTLCRHLYYVSAGCQSFPKHILITKRI